MIGRCMENLNQVREQRLPDTEFKLVHQVNNHHLGDIKSIPG